MSAFADLPEHAADGRIAEIYAEIRHYCAVPYVSSLQRQLATIPGCLEWLWDAIRPAVASGRVAEAAWARIDGLDLPRLAPVSRPALRVFGVDDADEPVLRGIYETFLRASPINMVMASMLGHLLSAPAGEPGPAEPADWTPPAAPPPLPGFPAESDMTVETREVLALFTVDMGGAAFVPGLYRLLAYWPPYLAHVATELLPLFPAPKVTAACGEVEARIDAIIPGFTVDLAAGPRPFDDEVAASLRRSLAVYRGGTSPQMIVFSRMLKDALPA